MKLTKQILPVALIAVVAMACNNTEYKKTPEGFPYKVFASGSGNKIAAGNVVRYHLTQKLGDSLLGTSYGTSARWMGIPKETAQITGLAKLLLEARQGDSIQIIQPIDSLIAKSPQPVQDSFLLRNKGKNINLFVKVVQVFTEESAAQAEFDKENKENYFKDPAMAEQRTKDVAALEAYLKANNIKTTQSPWGTYIQTITPGNGPKAKTGEYIMLRYTGKFMNGEEFDSNNKPGAPLMPLQAGAGGAIIGFEDGVKQLSKGEKAILYIPSVIGYGAQGMPPKIGPNENLIFEVEVVDIAETPPAPPTMPQADTSRK